MHKKTRTISPVPRATTDAQNAIRYSLWLGLCWLTLTQTAAQPASQPQRNFESFWRLFEQHYAHFETRRVDWAEQYRHLRPGVTPQTTDAQLLALLEQLVAPLQDGHVVISPTGDLPASAKYSRFYGEFPTKALQAQFHQVTLACLQQQGFGPFTAFQSAPYQLGGYCRSAEYGYVQLNGFGGMPLETFSRQLDAMVDDFADVKGLILDIRINGGGSPAFVSALVGRLTQVRRLVGYGRTRTGKTTPDYTPWTAYHVGPQGEKQLIVPTIVLTSGATISAGDHCALYLRELPYVRLVGEPTNGIFSPMWGARLPNGWALSLSNGQTVSAKRISYEGKGVPVDLLALHHRSTMQQGLDSVLIRAMGYLRQQQASLAAQTRCYEQLALAYYADSLLPRQIYGDVTAYSSGLVEEDATLLTPFARVCPSLKSAGEGRSVTARLGAEQAADSAFYHQNVATRFYVPLPRGIRGRMQWPFVKRNARRLTLSHHITLGDKQYVRLQLSQGRGKGQAILVVLNQQGQVIEHCALAYDYLSQIGY